jgi:hypothetical protein
LSNSYWIQFGCTPALSHIVVGSVPCWSRRQAGAVDGLLRAHAGLALEAVAATGVTGIGIRLDGEGPDVALEDGVVRGPR